LENWSVGHRKIENDMLRLVESLDLKRDRGDWIDNLIVREGNETYGEQQ